MPLYLPFDPFFMLLLQLFFAKCKSDHIVPQLEILHYPHCKGGTLWGGISPGPMTAPTLLCL